MTKIKPMPTPDELLFGNGLKVDNYFIERTPISEVICFESMDGRLFDLTISSEELKAKAVARLIELRVRVIDKR